MFRPVWDRFHDDFDTKKQRKMTLENPEIRGLNTKSLIQNRRWTRLRRRRFLSYLIIINEHFQCHHLELINGCRFILSIRSHFLFIYLFFIIFCILFYFGFFLSVFNFFSICTKWENELLGNWVLKHYFNLPLTCNSPF